MRKAVGCFVILALAAAVLSCESGLFKNTETAAIKSAEIKRDVCAAQGQERMTRGPRHEGRFRNFSEEEREQHFQRIRETGGKMGLGFRGGHRFIERLRLENPDMNDEELKALLRERFAARRAERPERSGREGQRGEWGRRPHSRGRTSSL